jgi:hypothetical protein
LGVKGEEKPLIVYGAASMNPSGKGELAVPVKYVYEKCKRKYKTIRVDERGIQPRCTTSVKRGQGGQRYRGFTMVSNLQ